MCYAVCCVVHCVLLMLCAVCCVMCAVCYAVCCVCCEHCALVEGAENTNLLRTAAAKITLAVKRRIRFAFVLLNCFMIWWKAFEVVLVGDVWHVVVCGMW